MAFDRKAYQREYARKKYQSLSMEERRKRNSSPSAKAAKVKYRKSPKAKAVEAAQCKRWYAANREKKNLYSRCLNYGLTVDAYKLLLDQQGNVCASCKNPFDGAPHIDHCHTTGTVRGILCFGCNLALGQLKESEQRIIALLDYVKTVVVPKKEAA